MILLGSSSPRRKEILSFFNLPFKQVPSTFDERSWPYNGNPLEYVISLATQKGRELALYYPGELILTADTVVTIEGKLLNKPSCTNERLEMLKRLRGEWHSVITAVCATKNSESATSYAQSEILFHDFSDEELLKYHNSFDGMDKAGGYGIQSGGSLIVKRMEGCFYGVMGLPPQALRDVLLKFEIDLFDYLKKEPS